MHQSTLKSWELYEKNGPEPFILEMRSKNNDTGHGVTNDDVTKQGCVQSRSRCEPIRVADVIERMATS